MAYLRVAFDNTKLVATLIKIYNAINVLGVEEAERRLESPLCNITDGMIDGNIGEIEDGVAMMTLSPSSKLNSILDRLIDAEPIFRAIDFT